MSEVLDAVLLMARDLQLAPADVINMAPAKFMAFQRHYVRHPRGDYRTHFLLARLVCAVENLFLGEGDEPLQIYDVGSWLNTPAVQEARKQWQEQEETRIAREGARAALTSRDRDAD